MVKLVTEAKNKIHSDMLAFVECSVCKLGMFVDIKDLILPGILVFTVHSECMKMLRESNGQSI